MIEDKQDSIEGIEASITKDDNNSEEDYYVDSEHEKDLSKQKKPINIA